VNKIFKRAKHIIVKNLDEVQTINVEPNWEGLYRFMMHLKKGDNMAFVRVTRKMGNDWEKLVVMAQKKKWQIESVKEAYGDLNDSGFKKVEKYNGIAIKLVKKLENAVKHSEGKDAVKWIKGLYDATGIMYDTIGHKMYYESVNEADGMSELVVKRAIDKAMQAAGIKILKIDKMKSDKIKEPFGWFYKVESVNGNDIMPFYVDKRGKVNLGVSSKDWIIGDVIGGHSKMVKNLKDYKKTDLDIEESIGEASLPGNVKRFMEKFVDALDNTGLNRKRKIAVLAGIIDALDIEPQKLISMINKIKSGIDIEGTIKEGVNKRLGWMDELIDQLGSEEKVLEEVFRALSDKEAKEVYDWIMRHWR